MRAKFWCIVELGQPKHRKIDVLPFLGGNDIERNGNDILMIKTNEYEQKKSNGNVMVWFITRIFNAQMTSIMIAYPLYSSSIENFWEMF
jgi:hypothetical protein